MKIPLVNSAVKIRNAVLKEIGGERRSSFGISNPYDDVQALEARLSKKEGEILSERLRKEDWKENITSDQSSTFTNSEGGSICVYTFKPGEVMGGVYSQVTFYGKKKAKQSTYSLYD